MLLIGIISVIVSIQLSLTEAFRVSTSFTVSSTYQLSLSRKNCPTTTYFHFAPIRPLFMTNNDKNEKDIIIEYNDFDDEVGLESQSQSSTRQYSKEFDQKLLEKLQERIDEQQTLRKKNESIFSDNEQTQQYSIQQNKDRLFWGQSSVEFLALGISLFFILVVALLGDNLFSKISSSASLSPSHMVNADKILQDDFDRYGSSIYFESNDKSINIPDGLNQ